MPQKRTKSATRRAGRRTPEERVLEFFQTANLTSAKLVLDLARGKVRDRLARRTSKPKASAKRGPMKLPKQGSLQL